MVLSHEEFIRRFAMHILPKRFVKSVIMVFEQHLETKKLKNCNKIRHQPKEKPLKSHFQPKCSCCKTGNLVTIAMFDLGTATMVLEMSQSQPTPKNRFLGKGNYVPT